MEVKVNPELRFPVAHIAQKTDKSAVNSEQDKKLRKVCQDFEAVYTNYLLKSMRKTVQKSDLFGSGKEEEMYQDMMDTQICESAAKTNSIGIADVLYNQLRNRLQGEPETPTNEMRGNNR